MDFLVVAFKFSHIMAYYCKSVDTIKKKRKSTFTTQ